MKKIFFLFAILGLYKNILAQNVGIGTTVPNASALVDITSTNKGLLLPRMATSAITSIANPAKGLMVYDSTLNQLMVNMGTPATPNWQTIVANSGWGLNGNTGTSPTNNFIGTTDNQPLVFKANNFKSGLIDVSANANTGFGYQALSSNTSGYNNTANGYQALYSNTTGSGNTTNGYQALYSNTIGGGNTPNGCWALYSNTTGSGNTVNGYQSLYSNTTGNYNIASGHQALFNNTTGSYNIGCGPGALYSNINGSDNIAIGNAALGYNAGSIADYNTAVGTSALLNTTNSQYNTAVGYHAGGAHDNGYNNTFLGANTGADGEGYYNCIAIGKNAQCTFPSEAVIGNSSTVTIGGYVGWSVISDGRFKKNVIETVKGLDFIMKLRPVTYHLDVSGIDKKLNGGQDKKEMDALSIKAIAEKEKVLFSGFVAQEVEQAAINSGYDFSGVDKPKNENDFYRLRYAEFVVPLVKAVQEQQQMIETMRKRMDVLEEQNKILQQLMNKKN